MLRDLTERVSNLWSQLAYKWAMANPDQARIAPTWSGRENQYRLTYYGVLDDYLNNQASRQLSNATDADRQAFREYGDPALLVSRVVAGIVGETMSVDVPGALDEIPPAPPLPDRPTPPTDGDPVSVRIFTLQQERWETDATEAVDAWEEAWREQPGLRDRLERLQQWATDELLEQQVWLGQEDAVGLGDGVYVLGWDAETRRPNLQVFDPRSYFPVLDDDAFRRGYPTRVHFAWEEERTNAAGVEERWLRRTTYEIVPLTGPRRYPWAPDVDAYTTCVWTEAEWLLTDLRGDWLVDAVAPQAAKYRRTPPTLAEPDGQEIRQLDLQVDFIPVVHVPGVPSGREHYGRSILARVLQLIDDIQSTDSDTQAAAALAGTPMIALSGTVTADDADLVVKPGVVYQVGENGRMDVVDLSGSVEALRDLTADLLGRLSINIQIPGEVLGRVDDTGAESGFARSLKLGPYESLIEVLRLTTSHKYRLLLKFVQRLYQAAGEWEPGPTVDARLTFGSYLPQDQQQTVTMVVALVQAKVISRQTGARMLVDVGVDIADVELELDRVNADDFEGATRLLDATGDEEAVRRRLGLPGAGPRPEPPPEVDLPGLG